MPGLRAAKNNNNTSNNDDDDDEMESLYREIMVKIVLYAL